MKLLATFAALLASASSAFATEPETRSLKWKLKTLAVDANEGVDVGDIDGDGKLDVVAGRNWFASPDFVPKPVRDIPDWNGYVESNGDYLVDVNGDGRLDVIAGSFLPTQVRWFENPGADGWRLGKQWPAHVLVDTGRTTNEGQIMEDVDGDGKREWVVNSWNPKSEMVVWRLAPKEGSPNGPLEATPFVIGPMNGHGLGVGDISGDGKADILVGTGWYEQPKESAWSGPWTYHADWNLQASVPMIVVDVDQDGKKDIVWGNGHDYGLFWWKNLGADATGVLQWEKNTIDKSFSEAHSLIWSDLDQDGQAELITGKRYYAHNGGDPGGQEAPVLMYYKWNAEKKTFQRHDIDRGRAGTGLQVRVADVDGNGWQDVIVAGKSGTYIALNQGY